MTDMAQKQRLRWYQKIVQWTASTAAGSWVYARTLPHIDRILLDITDGKVALPEILAGIPVIELTTTGAKSGKPRTTPLLGIKDGEKWVVVASNWGSSRHPAWYHNIRSNPDVKVTADSDTGTYIAREASDDEYDEYWSRARELYAGFEAYARRSGDRDIPVLVLEPADGSE